MIVKYFAIFLALSGVALAGSRKDRDELFRPSKCPCTGEAYDAFGQDGYEIKGTFDRFEDRPSKEQKAYEKLQSRKAKRYQEDDDDDDVFLELLKRDSRWARDYSPKEEDEFVPRKDSKPRKEKKDKKYKRDQGPRYDVDEDYEPDFSSTASVSPQCQRFVNDVNKLVKCERRVSSGVDKTPKESRRTFETEGTEYPAVCRQFAHDPYKLIKCVRKTSFWSDFMQHPSDFVEPQEGVHPECQIWAHDPYKLSKCEYKLKKFTGDNLKKSAKGFY